MVSSEALSGRQLKIKKQKKNNHRRQITLMSKTLSLLTKLRMLCVLMTYFEMQQQQNKK